MSTQVTPAGGGLTNYDGQMTLQFPPNAVTSSITVTYTGLFSPTQALGSGRAAALSFTLEARDGAGLAVAHFQQPYTLTIRYDDAELAALGIDEQNLNLAFWNGNAWVNVLPCAGCSVDTVNNRLTAMLDHFTEFALVVKSLPVSDAKTRIFLPIVRK